MIKKIISHRGNVIGPNPTRENAPSYIDTAIAIGYDVEVDIRYIDEKFYLGHDEPQYEVTSTWMYERKDKLWFHCKNLEAAVKIGEFERFNNLKYNYFCHSSDDFVLTSNHYIWLHNLSLPWNNRCVIPLIDKETVIIQMQKPNVHGVCSDYVTIVKDIIKEWDTHN